jgi:hypothetical protein
LIKIKGIEYNFKCCRRGEFAEIEPELDMALGEEEPLIDGRYVYYRRGTGKIWVYRVAIEDFKVSCEKRHAYTKSKPKLIEVQT